MPRVSLRTTEEVLRPTPTAVRWRCGEKFVRAFLDKSFIIGVEHVTRASVCQSFPESLMRASSSSRRVWRRIVALSRAAAP